MYGPGFIFKLWLVFKQMNTQIYTRDDGKRDRFAGSCCGWRCRQAGFLIGCQVMCWLLMVFAIYALGAWVLPRAAHIRRHYTWFLGISIGMIALVSCVLGCVLGCTHTIPVHSVVSLTGISNGVVVSFSTALLPFRTAHALDYELTQSLLPCAS